MDKLPDYSSIVYLVDSIQSPFVINDLKKIAEKYKTVWLLSSNALSDKEKLPKNVIPIENYMKWDNFKPIKILFKNIFPIIKIYIAECRKLKKFLPLKNSLALLSSNIFKAESLISELKQFSDFRETTTFYSFWFYDCIYLAWLKKKGFINKAITRAHGGDLFEYRVSLQNKILFRNFQVKNLDHIFPVSDAGTIYLIKRYPSSIAKINTVFLGSKDCGLNPYSKESFTIVSCASFRFQKRIHKIAEMLLNIQIPVHWIHFGDERLNSNDPKIHEYIKNKELLFQKNNIQFTPMGYIANEDIYKFYQNNPVNLFISLSAHEGIPVSMMEAISFGIPVLSTDVGGCNEIVNEQTGQLIPLETPTDEIAIIVEKWPNSEKNTPKFREGVRDFWAKHFEIEKNYQKLFNFIIE